MCMGKHAGMYEIHWIPTFILIQLNLKVPSTKKKLTHQHLESNHFTTKNIAKSLLVLNILVCIEII